MESHSERISVGLMMNNLTQIFDGDHREWGPPYHDSIEVCCIPRVREQEYENAIVARDYDAPTHETMERHVHELIDPETTESVQGDLEKILLEEANGIYKAIYGRQEEILSKAPSSDETVRELYKHWLYAIRYSQYVPHKSAAQGLLVDIVKTHLDEVKRCIDTSETSAKELITHFAVIGVAVLVFTLWRPVPAPYDPDDIWYY